MDGRMDGKVQFNCVFRPDEECPVKTAFKLQPESLVEYCAVCYVNLVNRQEPRHEIVKTDPMTIVLQNLPKLLEMYSRLKKEEKDQFFNVIKLLADIQRMQ